MARPIKFKTKRQFKIVNKCIMCGKTIPLGHAICRTCDNKRSRALRRIRR